VWAYFDTSALVKRYIEEAVATYPLRTLDAIHVASAQLFAGRVPTPELIFVSADKRQTEVATSVGLRVRHIV